MKKILILTSVIILGFVLSFPVFSESLVTNSFNVEVKPGNVFPDFTLQKLDGRKILSKKVFNKNKKTLIIAAAEWCPNCQEELPVLEDFYKKNKNKYNFAVVFIERGSSKEKVSNYVKENGFTFPIYYDYNNVFINGTRLESVPTNILIDENNKIINIFVGTIHNENEFKQFFE
ncbi:MAG: TlpA family protein disulfide reductase [Leptotrichiaceae bacterium]|nr:TlpA family protein disulfide reductase [Leptotrichiaceae bacterium]MBP7101304.1 TlpA family protein disulfide reductase [Leptotrichiaceae bacterium]MBP7725033.1 TlpA family protein disulfide reductase [Leptotrichiaceae bacterium]MBP9629606.1 TlpA family protein disulfide reductase [Leptotrichiaceae bacterium]